MTLRTAGLLAFILLQACGVSPLMNHVRAQGTRDAGLQQPRNANCPMKFEQHNLCGKISEGALEAGAQSTYTFKLVFWNATNGNPNGPYVSPLNPPVITPWMLSEGMDHGNGRNGGTNGTVTPREAGVYHLSNVYFSMAGLWQIRVILTNARGEKEMKFTEFEQPRNR